MNDFLYGLGDMFTSSFDILPVIGGYSNVIVAVVLAIALTKAFMVVIAEEDYKGA